jgi:hypothetical protein
MELTITIGWWIIPALITLGVVVYGFTPAKAYGYYGADIAGALIMMAMIIVALAAWLVWALLK